MSNIIEIDIGSRIRMVASHDDPDPIPAGATGTITRITPFFLGYILTVTWDAPNNHRTLNVVLPEDTIEVINV